MNGNLYVNSNATLKNLTVNGTVFINPGPSGTVYLNSVNATNIVILSGGTASIYLNNVKATNLTVKDDDSIRIETNTGTAITNTVIQSGAILDVKAGSLGRIQLAPTTSGAIELRGNFGTSPVSISAPNTILNVAIGSQVGTLTVEPTASGTAVNNAGSITELKANAENVAIEGTQPGTVTPGTEVGLTTSVSSEAEFKAALEKGYAVINLTAGFEVDAPLQINNKVTVNGNSKTIKKSASFESITTAENVKVNSVVIASVDGIKINHLTVDADGKNGWESLYALQVYNAKDVHLDGVILNNGDGGLLVNGSVVTVNNIITSGNEFGGIEVSKGPEAGLSNSKLTINGKPQHRDASGKPAVWVYPGQGTLVSELYVATAKEQGNDKNQTYYNLKSDLSVYDFSIGSYDAVVAGTPVDVPVTLKALNGNKLGYEAVIAEVSTTEKPDGSAVTFYALDSNNTPIVQTDNGVWGPNTGFALSNNHDATTPFKVTFSKAGNYSIVVKLKDKATGAYIAEKTVNVTVAPATVPSA